MPSKNGCNKRGAAEPGTDHACSASKRARRAWDPLDMPTSSPAEAAVEEQHAKEPCTSRFESQQGAVPEAAAVVPAPADLPRICARPPMPTHSQQQQQQMPASTPTTSDAVNVSFGMWAMSKGHGDGTPSGPASVEGSLQHWARAADITHGHGSSDDRLHAPWENEACYGGADVLLPFQDEDCEDTATSSASDDSGSEGGSQGDHQPPSHLLPSAASATQQQQALLHARLAPGEEESLDSQRPLSAGQAAFSFGALVRPVCLQPYWGSASVGVKAK